MHVAYPAVQPIQCMHEACFVFVFTFYDQCQSKSIPGETLNSFGTILHAWASIVLKFMHSDLFREKKSRVATRPIAFILTNTYTQTPTEKFDPVSRNQIMCCLSYQVRRHSRGWGAENVAPTRAWGWCFSDSPSEVIWGESWRETERSGDQWGDSFIKWYVLHNVWGSMVW